MRDKDSYFFSEKFSSFFVKILRLAAYAFFIWAVSVYIYDRNLYSDIESWESVEHQKLRIINADYTTFTDSRFGGRSVHNSNALSVQYSYRVNGQEYEGSVISPNGSNPLTDELSKPPVWQ